MLDALASAYPMMSIRNTAVGALSEMLRKFPADIKLVREWFQSVMPLVMDNESSIQEECLTLFEELVVDRFATVASSRSGNVKSVRLDVTILKLSPEQELERLMPPWILSMLKGMADDSVVASCVKHVCISLGEKKRLRAGIALALQNIITSSRALWSSHRKEGASSQSCLTALAGAWLPLAEVSAFVPKAVGFEFLRTHWQLLEKKERLSQTISNVAVALPPDAAVGLAAELLERLEGFNMDPTEVRAHVKALHILCIQKAASAGDGLVASWVEELLETSGTIVNSYLSVCSKSDLPETSNPFKCLSPVERRKKVLEVGRSKIKVKR